MEFEITDIKVCDEHNTKGHRARTTKLYVFPEGETLLENLYNRKHRPISVYRKAAKKALEKITAGTEREIKLRWSQRCGCTCPCSPGFFVEGFVPVLNRKNVYVTIK